MPPQEHWFEPSDKTRADLSWGYTQYAAHAEGSTTKAKVRMHMHMHMRTSHILHMCMCMCNICMHLYLCVSSQMCVRTCMHALGVRVQVLHMLGSPTCACVQTVHVHTVHVRVQVLHMLGSPTSGYYEKLSLMYAYRPLGLPPLRPPAP